MEPVVVGLFLAFFFSESVAEFTLNELNLRYVRRRSGNPALPEYFQGRISSEEYRKSVEYTLAKGRYERWAAVYGALMTLWILFGGVLPALDEVSRDMGALFPPVLKAAGIFFCSGAGLILSLLSLPTALYATFVLEDRFGFNKTTVKLFFADKLKGFLISLVIGIPFLFGVLYLMEETGSHWWLWVFLFILSFQMVIVLIYPTWIAPLFNKFEPLKEGEMRARILALAERVGFKTSGIYTMDGSRRSGHSNAYFTGLGKARRIVLFDTLLEQMTVEQGLAVLAHEMGHYKMKHVRKMLLVQGILLFTALFILSLLIGYGPLFRAFGLEPSSHAALVLLGVISGPFTFYLTPLLNILSRKHENEADAFAAATLKDSRPMQEALLNLSVKNLSNPTPHPWYSAYHYSHPTTAERIQALQNRIPAIS